MRDGSLPLAGAAGDDHAFQLFQGVDGALRPHGTVASHVHGVRRPGDVECAVQLAALGVVLLGVDDRERMVAADNWRAMFRINQLERPQARPD